jgi:NADPH:quinone reductase-like Zn-dependent oxidoreductase
MEEAKKFNAVMTDGAKPYHAELEGRELKEDEVLVKIHAAPINPSDQMYAVGMYGVKKLLNKYPTGCGFEGAGEVTDVS